jgi:hypothetical protein
MPEKRTYCLPCIRHCCYLALAGMLNFLCSAVAVCDWIHLRSKNRVAVVAFHNPQRQTSLAPRKSPTPGSPTVRSSNSPYPSHRRQLRIQQQLRAAGFQSGAVR